jgi:hypothetical protein
MSFPPSPYLLALLLLAGTFVMLVVRAVREAIALHRVRDGATREHDIPRVASYLANLVQPHVALPARTWSDLDMDDVFRAIDRTASWPGQHLLYARLRREDHSPEAMRQFETGVTSLSDDEALRTRIRDTLKPLDDLRASNLPALFQLPIPAAPRLAIIFPVLSLAGIVCLVAAFWWPSLVLAVVGLALLNAFVRVALRERVDRMVPAMRMLPTMLHASRGLAAIQAPALAPHIQVLRDAAPRLEWLGRAARWLSFEPTGGNEAAGYFYEYLNLLFLLDVTSYAWSVDAIRAERAMIERVYAALGELDVLQAVATLRLGLRPWTRPVLGVGAERALAFVGLTHPLLDRPVPNSLEMVGQSVLLTGSNMSGKSTFIRAVGVNAVLARTINTVFAEHWCAPRLTVRTSIGRADSILEGKSYYQAEVDVVRALLEPNGGGQRLVLIDELFRGTNSIERVAAARAVLGRLDRGGDLVIIATHDVELLELLPEYAPYHFREEVQGQQLTFDYRLRRGACSTRNALAILALAGYPPAVVEDATITAELLEQRVVGKVADTTTDPVNT